MLMAHSNLRKSTSSNELRYLLSQSLLKTWVVGSKTWDLRFSNINLGYLVFNVTCTWLKRKNVVFKKKIATVIKQTTNLKHLLKISHWICCTILCGTVSQCILCIHKRHSPRYETIRNFNVCSSINLIDLILLRGSGF